MRCNLFACFFLLLFYSSSALAQEENAPTELKYKAQMILDPFFAFTSISHTDSFGNSADVNSRIYAGAKFSYVKRMSEKLFVSGSARTAFLNWIAPDSSQGTMTGPTFTLGAAVSADYVFNERLVFSPMIGYGHELFGAFTTPTDVRIDAVFVPSAGGRVSYDVIDFSKFTLGISGSFELKIAPMGSMLGGSIYAKERVFYEVVTAQPAELSPASLAPPDEEKIRRRRIDLGFYIRNQNNTSGTQGEKMITLSIKWFFGPKE